VEKSCSSPQCFNGGVCVNTAISFKCICPIDYEGQRCDLSKSFTTIVNSCLFYLHLEWNDCASHSCQHGSTCVDGVASYTCQCARGFTGKYCEISTILCETRTERSVEV
jgi:Notch-like protein